MTLPLLYGAGFGLGLWAILVGLFPPRPTLADTLTALRARPATTPIVASDNTGWAAHAGRPFVPLLDKLGLPAGRTRRDLAVLGRPTERHLAEKATAALVGLLVPPVTVAACTAVGIRLPLTVPLWGSLLLAAAGFVVPDLGVRVDAAARRADFRHALGGFLDLVVIALAGGAGVDGALADASKVGTGWSFTQLRRALDRAQLGRVGPWETLGRLGHELGVPALSELAASVSLAGTEGAKVRSSLAAKAAALRAHELTDAEGQAQAATERMSLPTVALFGGFLAFLAYPALMHVFTSL